jgi:hypothetical protein
MTKPWEINRWYLYKNGDYKEIFYCQTIDGEYGYWKKLSLINFNPGYSMLLCRPVSKAYRFLHSDLIKYIP